MRCLAQKVQTSIWISRASKVCQSLFVSLANHRVAGRCAAHLLAWSSNSSLSSTYLLLRVSKCSLRPFIVRCGLFDHSSFDCWSCWRTYWTSQLCAHCAGCPTVLLNVRRLSTGPQSFFCDDTFRLALSVRGFAGPLVVVISVIR
jgi:hypothetical protein